MNGREKGAPAWGLFAALALAVSLSFVFRIYNWGQGPVRGALLAATLLIVAQIGLPARAAVVGERLKMAMTAVIATAAIFWIWSAAESIGETARTGVIPLDQGQTTWRAARLLLRGENPYGFGQLVDIQAVVDRWEQREAAGLKASVPYDQIKPAFEAYDRDLDPGARAALLPPGAAGLEARLLGYKYGPMFLYLTTPLALVTGPAALMALNVAAAVAMALAVYLAMRSRVGDSALAALGLTAILCDSIVMLFFVERSGTDVWALLCGALAVLACQRGRYNLGAAALAVGFGFKILPSALFFPMLLTGGRWRPALVFAGVAAAIYLPFAVVDPEGLLRNVFLWPQYLSPDSTSWLAHLPPLVRQTARVVGLCGIAFVWARYLTGREPSLFKTLALVALLAILSSPTFHNNYFPWASIWLYAALVERFGPPFAARAQAPAVAAPALA